MYSESYVNDAKLVVKAFLSNQLARVAPALYMRATRETGRGAGPASAEEIADYFIACFDEYFEHLGIAKADIGSWLNGRTVLEYGPGDVLGVALLFHAHGAAAVHCVDRFPLAKRSDFNVRVYARLLETLDGPARSRAAGAFVVDGDPASGFRPEAVAYHVRPNGLSGRAGHYDLVVSRAVLEHVNDLEKTMADVATALKDDGISIHQVDLKSHGLDRYQPFDFLTWPDPVYRVMFSHKGFPNRWRVDKYRDVARRVGLSLLRLVPTGRLAEEQVALIAPKVAPRFRAVPPDELGWLGFWMTLRRGGPA